ncbi:MFS transporter (plasmid) [Novosphingobium sp. BL-8A]|uniref:MFS transporter n=1 Tax=Novosphingobium sp. BL-8A TaxID=3127639 RepID=UPI003756E06B
MEARLNQGSAVNVRKLAGFAFLLGIVPQAMIEAAVTAALPESARDLGVNGEFMAQMMMGMGALGLMLGAFLSGRVLERFGSRQTYLASLVALGLFGGAGLIVENVWLLFGSRVIAGFAASCITTTCMWGITSSFEAAGRGRRFGMAGSIGGLSAIASVITGGFLTQHLGWRFAFIQYVVVALTFLPFIAASVEQRHPESMHSNTGGFLGRVAPLYVQVLVLYSVIGMFSMQLPFMLNAAGMVDAGARSLIQGIPGLGVIFGGVVYGVLHQRIGAVWTLISSVGLFGLGLLSIATNHAVVPLTLGAAAAGLCMGMSMPYFYHAVSGRTGAAAGRYLGYLSACTFFGVFSNPMIFEPLKAMTGVRGLFLMSAGILIVMAAATALTSLRKPTAAPS